MTLLQVDDVVVRYGQAVAVDGVSLEVGARERVALIGPNGAGKSSVLNAACGVVRPAAGRAHRGRGRHGASPGSVVRRGVSQVPEGRHVFATLPVEANLLLGAYGRVFSLDIVSSTLRYLRSKDVVRERLERVYTCSRSCASFATGRRRARPGPAADGRDRSRAHGRAAPARDRRALARARAALLVQQLAEFLLRLNEEDGVAILLVDQSAASRSRSASARTCWRRAVSSSTGRAATRGRDEVRSAYLGGPSEGGRDDVLPARRGRHLDRIGLRDRRHVARPRVPRDGDRQLRPGRLRGPRRPADVLARQARVARRRGRARDAAHGVRGDARRGRRSRHPRAHDAAREPDRHGRHRALAEAVLLASFGEVPRSYSAVSDTAWDVGGVLVQPQYAVLAAVAVAAAFGLAVFLRRTIVGQALVASADSPRAAELIGLNLRSVAVIAFAIAGALTAIGGVLLAPTVPVAYNADLSITINGFAAAVFGGFASIRLALLGGYALGVVEQLVVGYVDPQYNLIIALAVMLVLIGWRSRSELRYEPGAVRVRRRPRGGAPPRGPGGRDDLRLLAAFSAGTGRRRPLRPHGPLRARSA